MERSSFIKERKVGGYLFKLFDEDEWGYLVEIWKNGEKIATEWITCAGANCEPSDEELLALLDLL